MAIHTSALGRLHRFLMAACLFSLALGAATAGASTSPDELWRDRAEDNIARTGEPRRIVPAAYRTLALDRARLTAVLARTPLESRVAVADSGARLTLPLADGRFEEFQIVESPIMEPELAARFPEIRTWLGQGIDDRTATLRFDLTPTGFHAQIISWEGTTYIDPFQPGDVDHYISYRKRDVQEDGERMRCLVTGEELPEDVPNFQKRGVAVKLASGTSLRTYRAAVAATGEYTAFHGGTVALGFAAIVTTMNRVTGIYERDLSVRMLLVANNNLIVYTNPATDPYTNNNGLTMLGENQANLTSVIGGANYDIGHVVSTGGGGVAGLGVVCNAGSKARGVTGSSSPVGDAFDVDYVAHEIGHQFGGNHTFNSITGGCGGGNRNASTAYETGSGITIQAYAGICGLDDVQPNSSDYFHRVSLDEMLAFTTGASCGTATPTGNTPPVVTPPAAYTIPRLTPFALTASGSDANGDTLTYLWEQFDLGAANSPAGSLTDNGGPLFRNFNPTTSPTRTFPALPNILNGLNDAQWEQLPTTNRTINFRVTARDNRAGGGGTNDAATALTVTTTAGPFLVTAPNTAVTWDAGLPQTVTWDVANTTAAPVGTATVRIRLSLDGGASFPLVLASGEPNDGSATLALVGATPTTQARIKVEAENNVYFDISNANFTIAGTATPVVINELDADTPGTDVAEFIELYDGGVGNTPLDGLVLVLYNGSNDLSYAAFDLDGHSTDAGGYFVICGNAANTANCDLDVTPNSDLIQNGQDAAALFVANATDFPTNTPVTTTNLVDAIVYDTSDADDPGLLVLLNAGQPQVDENANANSANQSNQRCQNGSGGRRNTSTYLQAAPSPGAANSCPVAGIVVTESGGSTNVTEGGATDSYTVVLNSPPSANVGINIVFDPAQVVVNGDTDGSLSLQFTPANWNVAQTVTVGAVDDTLVEADPHGTSIVQTVSSSDPVYAVINPADVTVSIAENDTREITFVNAGSSAGEPVGTHIVNARLNVVTNGTPGGTISADMTANVFLVLGSAELSDLILATPQLTFPAGSAHNSTLPINLTVANDRLLEDNETGTLNLGLVGGGGSVSGTHVVTVTDDEIGAIGFTAPGSATGESAGTHSGAIGRLTISGTGTGLLASEASVSVAITDAPGTATTPADYTRTTASISFAAGSVDGATQPILASIVDDALFEGDHDFALGFGAVTATSAAVTAAGTHMVMITDNDPMPTLSITSPSQPEGNGGATPMNFTVSLSAAAGVDVSFTYATADGTATVIDNDYQPLAPPALMIIGAGELGATLMVPIIGDTTFEGIETFSLNLTNIVNATVPLPPTIEGTPASLSGTGTIEEDDQQPTVTTIVSDDPDASVVGEPYTVSVTVSSQTLSPAGTVIVSDGSASCGPVALTAASSPNSSASCALTSTTAGTKTLTASYTAATTAFGDSSGTASHQVNTASTAISVSGPPRSRINQPTPFSVALSVNAPGAGSPTGTLTLTSGASSCTATLPATSCNLTFDALGSRIVTASYSGDGNFGGSTSSGAGNMQTLVYALSDLVVTKNDGVGTYTPGDLLVYSVIVRNLGPDAAVGIRVVDIIPAGLTDVVWSCDASGGVACPVPGGSGNLDVVIASFPVGGLLNFTFYGNVDGSPAQLVNTALVELPADTTVEDPAAGNNSATDADLLDRLFANGFESIAVNAQTGSFRIPGAALRAALDEVAVVVYRLDDADGEALRVYARVIGIEMQYALATRNAQGQLRLAAWRSFTGDPTLSWTARPANDGWVLESAELR